MTRSSCEYGLKDGLGPPPLQHRTNVSNIPDVRQNVGVTEQCRYQLKVPMLTAEVMSYHVEGKEDARGKEAASSPCRRRHQQLELNK